MNSTKLLTHEDKLKMLRGRFGDLDIAIATARRVVSALLVLAPKPFTAPQPRIAQPEVEHIYYLLTCCERLSVAALTQAELSLLGLHDQIPIPLQPETQDAGHDDVDA
jgi:hypothetical protein